MLVYLALFASAFVSATLFPMASEALLIYDLTQGHNIYILVVVATVGNTLGSMVNYWMGLGGERYLESRGVIDRGKFQRFRDIFVRYGGYTLLLSWMPIVGDMFTFVAGVARYSFMKFFVLVLIAKFGRYIVVSWAYISI